MKVTKAKALFIRHSGVAARVRPISAMPQPTAEHLLRPEIAPMRSEAWKGMFAKQTTVLLLGPL